MKEGYKKKSYLAMGSLEEPDSYGGINRLLTSRLKRTSIPTKTFIRHDRPIIKNLNKRFVTARYYRFRLNCPKIIRFRTGCHTHGAIPSY